jgi:probable metal-binding protein
MRTITSINSNEIVDIVSANPKGIRLSRLIEKVSAKFGPSVTFHTSSHIGIDLDSLLVFLEARNKIQIVRGVVMPGHFSSGTFRSTPQPAQLAAGY